MLRISTYEILNSRSSTKLGTLHDRLQANEAVPVKSDRLIEVDQQDSQNLKNELMSMKELVTTVGDEKDALAKERNSLISEKQHLEETISQSREEAERSSTAANERVAALETEIESLVRVQEELALKQNELRSLRERTSKLSEENSALIEDKASLVAEKETRENHLSALGQDLKEAETTSRAAKEKIHTLDEQVKSLVTESEELRKSQIPEEDFLSLKDNVKELTEEKTALLKEVDALNDEKEKLQQEISTIRHELEEAEKRSKAAEERVEYLEKEGKALGVDLEESRRNASALNEERAVLLKEKDSLVSETSTLEGVLKRSKQELEDVQKMNLTLEEKTEALVEEVKSLEQANKALVDSQIPEDEFRALKDKASRLSQEKATVEEEKDLLLSEKKELEGEVSKKKQELDEVTKLHITAQEQIAALKEGAERRDRELHRTKKVLIHIC